MKHAVDIHVGKMIRHRRWACGLTQPDLSDRVGVKFQQIHKYETGQTRVSASRLWDIATTLQVPIQYFYQGLRVENEIADPLIEQLIRAAEKKDAVELLRLFHAMTSRNRQILSDIAKAMEKRA